MTRRSPRSSPTPSGWCRTSSTTRSAPCRPRRRRGRSSAWPAPSSSIAAVELGRYERDAVHHFVLTRDAAEDVFRTLATERLADRVHNPGLQRERADIIVGGACILVAVLRTLRATDLLVSETDLLDALALRLV